MYDVIQISYSEPLADEHFARLLRSAPHAKRIQNVPGIANAHRKAALLSATEMFFVVDADAKIMHHDFSFVPQEWDRGYTHLWYARNFVNRLEYGWGGIKLFPRQALLDISEMPLDMTTSLPLKVIEEVTVVSVFNQTAESTWRSAFREAAKLSLSSDKVTQERLVAWLTVARGDYADECLRGAYAGTQAAEKCQGDRVSLGVLINDYAALDELFSA